MPMSELDKDRSLLVECASVTPERAVHSVVRAWIRRIRAHNTLQDTVHPKKNVSPDRFFEISLSERTGFSALHY
jgi:hypothetical protein